MTMSDEEMHEFANELNERIEKSLEENYRKRILVSARNLKNNCKHTNCEECFFSTEDKWCSLAKIPVCWENKKIGENDE